MIVNGGHREKCMQTKSLQEELRVQSGGDWKSKISWNSPRENFLDANKLLGVRSVGRMEFMGKEGTANKKCESAWDSKQRAVFQPRLVQQHVLRRNSINQTSLLQREDGIDLA